MPPRNMVALLLVGLLVTSVSLSVSAFSTAPRGVQRIIRRHAARRDSFRLSFTVPVPKPLLPLSNQGARATGTYTTPLQAASSNKSAKPWMTFPPVLSRRHEVILFGLYGTVTSALLCASASRSLSLHAAAEVGVALVWVSKMLAISFTESWVKFRAPFLKKYAALDVGRHVFASLNAIELALSASFWMGRVWCCQLSKATGRSKFFLKNSEYYLQPSFVLPAAATVLLVVQVTTIAPVLFLRAKSIIVRSFAQGPLSARESLSKVERDKLADITLDTKASLRHGHSVPSNDWHKAYAALEVAKVGCLMGFIILKWLSI